MSFAGLLVNRCTLQRWTPRTKDANHTLDGASYANISTGVACNIQEISGRPIQTAGGQKAVVNGVGYFLPSLTLKPASSDTAGDGDLLVLTDPATSSKYEVLAVVDQVGRQKFKKAFLRTL